MNIPGPTEVHIRAMAAILAQPRVWHMSVEELQEVAAAATNGRARPWRVKCTIKIMRRGRGLGNIVKGDTSMTNENEALRRSDDALKRIEALESRLWRALAQFDLLEDVTIPPIDALEAQLERAIQRINALEALASTASAPLDELAVPLGDPTA